MHVALPQLCCLLLSKRCLPSQWQGTTIACLGLMLHIGVHTRSQGAELTCRSSDAVWEISSRNLPDCPGLNYEPTFTVHENADHRWWPQTLDSLRAHIGSHPEQRIVFYIHGNWMPQCDARERAVAVYRRLAGYATDSGPICFISFSWPSERREGFARDVIGKKSRLDTDSYYLALAIERLQLQQSTGFIGFSFGAAVLCGAQHLLAGGNLCGYQLDASPSSNLPARISMVAPAFDRQELTVGGRYQRALEEADSVVNLYNSIDPILKRFRFFDRDTSPVAAGFAGLLELRSDAPLASNSTIAQFDCRSIGRTHAELDYWKCSHARRAFENVLGTDTQYTAEAQPTCSD